MQKFLTKYEQLLFKSAVNRSYTKTKWASSLKCKDDSTYANKNSTHNDRMKCNDQMMVFTDTEFKPRAYITYTNTHVREVL